MTHTDIDVPKAPEPVFSFYYITYTEIINH